MNSTAKKVYDFREQLELAKRCEALIDTALAHLSINTLPVSIEIEKRLGIDRIATRPGVPDYQVALEYKSDFQAQSTGNFFIETKLQHDDGSESLGWARKSVAQYFVLHKPQTGEAYTVPGIELKLSLSSWSSVFRTVSCQNAHWKSWGVLVPELVISTVPGVGFFRVEPMLI